uniref:Uncharacterized protein n=1 Tax=Anguilla anguilla TaxID=7936 RepID=A0A0E9V4F7_ANGAN
MSHSNKRQGLPFLLGGRHQGTFPKLEI